MPKLVILLATYNGARYISDLLDSIERQLYTNFQVLVRDDASTDGTLRLIQQHSLCRMGRISFVDNLDGNKGVIRNFEALLQCALSLKDVQWIAFADQDDVWLPDKLSSLLEAVEKKNINYKMPLLMASDLTVVDHDLCMISPSFWRYEGIDVIIPETSDLLVRNIFPGCSMLMNRALVEAVLPFPDGVIMHDWWIALVASIHRIVLLDRPLMLYRQHVSNSIGAKNRTAYHSLHRLIASPLLTCSRIQILGERVLRQAVAFLEFQLSRGGPTLVAHDYVQFRKKNFFQRVFSFDSRFFQVQSAHSWIRLILWSRIAN